jgi:hypothetical protein
MLATAASSPPRLANLPATPAASAGLLVARRANPRTSRWGEAPGSPLAGWMSEGLGASQPAPRRQKARRNDRRGRGGNGRNLKISQSAAPVRMTFTETKYFIGLQIFAW